MQISTLDGKVKSRDESQHLFGRRIASAEDSVRAVKERISALQSDLDFNQEIVRKFDDKFDPIQSLIQLNGKKTKELESLIPGLQDRLTVMEERMRTTEGRLTARALKVAEVTTKLMEFESKFKTTDQKLSKAIVSCAKSLDLEAKCLSLERSVQLMQGQEENRGELLEDILRPLKQNGSMVSEELATVGREQEELRATASRAPSQLKPRASVRHGDDVEATRDHGRRIQSVVGQPALKVDRVMKEEENAEVEESPLQSTSSEEQDEIGVVANKAVRSRATPQAGTTIYQLRCSEP